MSVQYEQGASEQAEAAAARVHERTEERLTHVEQLKPWGGIGHADTLERVALRVDRVSRQVAGEPLPTTPAEQPDVHAAPEAVIAAAVERVQDKLDIGDALRDAQSAEDAAGIVLEAVIGEANFLEVRYLGAGARAARAVGRVVLRSEAGRIEGYGTGSLVSPRLLLTNHHVLESAAVARRASIEFDFEDGLDDRPLRPVSFRLDPDAFFLNDRALDFALVAVRATPAELRRFGFNRLLEVGGRWSNGDFVTIIQHPEGRAKEVALRENRVVDSVDAFVHYSTDTKPGSSGSPVFNDNWDVVALHHASTRARDPRELGPIINEGIRIGPVLRWAREHVTPGQEALLAGVVLAESIAVVGPAEDSDTVDVSDGAGDATDDATATPVAPVPTARVVQGDGRDGALRVTIPIELTLSVGTVGAAPAAPDTAVADTGPLDDERIAIDPDYANRRGYDPAFLGSGALRVPLPKLPPELLAAAARLKGSDAHVIPYHHFSVVMHGKRALAIYTAVNLDGRRSVRIKRDRDRWSLDPRLEPLQQTGEAVYESNPLDRGHLVRRLDPAWGATLADAKRANDDTFHFTNCTPQHEDFNQNSATWAGLEDYILDNADNLNFRASVFTGPVLADDDDSYRGVKLPRQFWKVVVMARRVGRPSATAYLLSQSSLIEDLETVEAFSYGAYKTFQVRVRRIEELTGLTFGALREADPLAHFEATGEPIREITPREAPVL